MIAMAEPSLYSRVVRILKIALPLTALAILSVLFILAEQLDPDAAIPYADVDVEQLLREQGITNPSFGGVTEAGDRIALKAERLQSDQGGGDAMTAAVLTGAMEFATGRRVDIDAPKGLYDAGANRVELTGGVRLDGSDGFRVETDRVAIDLTTGEGETGPIVAEGPPGRLTAGSMALVGAEDGNILVFQGGVRLLFYPDQSRKDDDQ